MDKLNINFTKAGLTYLIDQDKETFINRLSKILQDKLEIIEYLFEGPLPITEDIVSQLQEYVKSSLPCPEDFIELQKVDTGFNYNGKQIYLVTYLSNRYYDKNKEPYRGVSVKDEQHQICIPTENTTSVDPSYIKFKKQWQMQ